MSIQNAIPCEHCGAPRGSDCEPWCPEAHPVRDDGPMIEDNLRAALLGMKEGRIGLHRGVGFVAETIEAAADYIHERRA